MRDPGYDAEDLLTEAIDLDPNYGEAYFERAKFLISHKKAEAAIVDLNRAAALMPNSPDVYLAYASAYLALDENYQRIGSRREGTIYGYNISACV